MKRGDARATEAAGKGERIAKRLARAGLCSRREAERWIAEGRVAVDGQVLATPAVLVTAESRIVVDGKPVGAAEATRLWRYHKPRGLVTTHRDPQGRATIFQSLPPALPRVISIGRLDLSSEGLLLLTNDGALARHLELPSTGWVRRYRVRVHGRVDPKRLAALGEGVTIAGIVYGAVEAELERQQGSNAWLTFGLREGKNREIRRICEHLDLVVTRLIRTSYGPFQLGTLERGAVEEVPVKVLKEQLGAFVAQDTPSPPARPRSGKGAGAARRKAASPKQQHAHRRRQA
ncbi:MAG: rRNA pseudouridine synthase [Rhodospirillaceae bacterium]|nr:rRNA pseudouridine synthase [Rhodospirillaceae bacterium]